MAAPAYVPNRVPWHMACERTGARVRVARADGSGDLGLNRLAGPLTARTKMVAVPLVSNVLGRGQHADRRDGAGQIGRELRPQAGQTTTGASMAGTLVVIGGHEDREGEKVILREVARRADRKRVVVVGTASEEPEGLFEQYRMAFTALG